VTLVGAADSVARVLSPVRLRFALAALALLAGAPAARAESETATSGSVTATFSYTKKAVDPAPTGAEYRNLRLSVTRAGAAAYDKAVSIKACKEPYCVPGGYKKSSLQAVDLNGDGEPEITLDVYTGGAHCCIWSLVLSWNGSAYVARTHDWRDPGYTLEDGDGDSKPEFISGDARFAYKFASFASSGFPVQIWNFDPAKGFVDVTNRFPDSIRADRDEWWKSFQKQRKRGRSGEPLGPLAAWAADQYRLGNRTSALKRIRTLQKQGKLRGGISGLGPGAKRFPGALDRFLKRLGYV